MDIKRLYILSLLITAIVFLACNTGIKQNTTETTISDRMRNDSLSVANYSVLPPKQFAAKMQNIPKYKVIDLRTKDELNTHGKIKGAVNIDFYNADFKLILADMDKNRPIFVYCDDGERSRKACVIMQDMHFKIVYDLKGGLNRWKKDGYEIVQQ